MSPASMSDGISDHQLAQNFEWKSKSDMRYHAILLFQSLKLVAIFSFSGEAKISFVPTGLVQLHLIFLQMMM